jgi:hypothetical protein
MANQWAEFQLKAESSITPLLFEKGYILQMKEQDEGNKGILYIYRKDSTHRISIDLLRGKSVESGTIRNFNCVHVELPEGYLKTLLGMSSNENIYLRDGWIWTTESELEKCVEEIALGLKSYFEGLI